MKRLFSAVLLALLTIPLLSACGSLFDTRPKHMTIEYDEEVKLHNGEMIWVHITRHYFYTSEPAHGGAYMPSSVEISWDTGFEGVGRRSVYFTSLSMIEKRNDTWYLFGGSSSHSSQLENSVNCKKVATAMGKSKACFVAINKFGDFIKPNENELFVLGSANILNPIGIKDWGQVPNLLSNKTLSWSEKLDLQKYQSQKYQFIGHKFNKEKFQ